MSGALAERVFAHKIEKLGFERVTVHDRVPFALADAERYPLFTDELIGLMRELLPPERHHEVAVAVTVSAVRPGPAGPDEARPDAPEPSPAGRAR